MKKFGQDHSLIHEAVVTGRKVGAEQEFWAALAHDEELFQKVVAFVGAIIFPVFRLVADFDRDMRNEGWELLSDNGVTEGEFVPELLELFRDEDSCFSVEDAIRNKENGDYGGQRHAEAMLRDRNKIPKTLRRCILLFPENVLLDLNKYPCIPSLEWKGDDWSLGFCWFELMLKPNYRIVRPRKQR